MQRRTFLQQTTATGGRRSAWKTWPISADDDPRTAEVLSKVILLARDHEIQDPNILDQLRS